jgi:hypothetical protein
MTQFFLSTRSELRTNEQAPGFDHMVAAHRRSEFVRMDAVHDNVNGNDLRTRAKMFGKQKVQAKIAVSTERHPR